MRPRPAAVGAGPRLSRRLLLGLPLVAMACRRGPRPQLERSPVILPPLRDLAASYVDLAESDRDPRRLWGRLGGSDAERKASRLFTRQIVDRVDDAWVEDFAFRAHRPIDWRLEVVGGEALETAMPMPFDARLPAGPTTAEVVEVSAEDLSKAAGRWALIRTDGDSGLRAIRSLDLYQRAVAAGAAGLVVSADPRPGRWRFVPPVDKAFALLDERYPDGERPIPALCCDFEDGGTISRAAAVAGSLGFSTDYQSGELQGLNAVGLLRGATGGVDDARGPRPSIVVMAHLDAFFQGAHDNAGGLAVLLAMAHRLAQTPRAARPVDLWFVALSAHHDRSEGLRAFRRDDPERWSTVVDTLLVEHVDAQAGLEGEEAGWPANFNDDRVAYVGPAGRPEIEELLPVLVRTTGLMTVAPEVRRSCIGDLHVTCGERPGFCLMQAAPYYHTDHDTLDKLSERVLAGAVDFHLKILEVMGGVDGGLLPARSLAPGSPS